MLAKNDSGGGCGCLLIILVLVILGACVPKGTETDETEQEYGAESNSSAYDYGREPASDDYFAKSTPAPIPSTTTPASPPPVRVYPSSTSERLHPCESRWATIPAPGYFICDYGPDGILRWVDDDDARAAAAQARNDAFWVENPPLDYVPPIDVPVDTYTGNRCYDPGGVTYRQC